MDVPRGYRDSDIEKDLKDVDDRLDKAIELAKITALNNYEAEVKKLIEETKKKLKEEKVLLEKKAKAYDKNGEDISFVDFLKMDPEYQKMKNQNTEWLKELQLEINKRQLEQAKEITKQAEIEARLKQLEKINKEREKDRNIERGR